MGYDGEVVRVNFVEVQGQLWSWSNLMWRWVNFVVVNYAVEQGQFCSGSVVLRSRLWW